MAKNKPIKVPGRWPKKSYTVNFFVLEHKPIVYYNSIVTSEQKKLMYEAMPEGWQLRSWITGQFIEKPKLTELDKLLLKLQNDDQQQTIQGTTTE